jgi:hypothetical protein
VAWHQAFVSNGPTEGVNNLIKRVKRIGFGFRRFTRYRTLVLLYAGKPSWDLLTTITLRRNPMSQLCRAASRSGGYHAADGPSALSQRLGSAHRQRPQT